MGAMALSIGSTVAKKRAASQAEKAREKVLDAEKERQAGFAADARKRFAEQLALVGGDQAVSGVDEARAEQDAYHAQALAGFDGGDLPASERRNDDRGADDFISNQIQRGLAEASDRSARKSALDAYGRETNTFNRGLNRTSSDLGKYANFSASSINQMNTDLAEAQNKGSGWGFIGELLGGGAQAAAVYGANQPATATPVHGASPATQRTQ